MAYIFKRDQQYSEVARATLVTAKNGDNVFFTSTAEYVAVGRLAHVLRATGSATLSVDGALYSGDGSTVWLSGSTSTAEMRVGRGGLIFSDKAEAIDAWCRTLSIVNAGEIAGGRAIRSVAGDTSITNEGAIHGGTGISWEGQTFFLSNSGSIAAESTGVSLTGAAGGTTRIVNSGSIVAQDGAAVIAGAYGDASIDIVNHGVIAAGTVGIFSSGSNTATGARTIVNTGTVTGTQGSIVGLDGIEAVINSGTLIGDVELGGGADSYDGRRGSVDGVVRGESGDDELSGGSEDDILSGGAGNDIVRGRGGDDWLIAGSGDDVLNGGAGVDIASFRDATQGVVAYLDMRYGGARYISMEGLEGSSFNDILTGTSSRDYLYGGEGDDDLYDGGGGEGDVLVGGAGSDGYRIGHVTSGSSVVVERPGEGTDTVYSEDSVVHLWDNVESLQLVGAGNLSGTGNDLDNIIQGNTSANIIDGGLGDDFLVGGPGRDTYMFSDNPYVSGTVDQLEFVVQDDFIALRNGAFIGLNNGPITADEFRIGTAAVTPNQHIIYDNTTGFLYFDFDGSGATPQAHFATLSPGLSLSAANFIHADYAP